jgi:hypothetical protein
MLPGGLRISSLELVRFLAAAIPTRDYFPPAGFQEMPLRFWLFNNPAVKTRREKKMKRASSYVLALFLATGMALAQTGGDKKSEELNPQPLPPGHKVQAEAKTNSAKKGKQGGKKSKKGSSTNSGTPAPK